MSSHEASRVNFNLTFADVLVAVLTADLPERQRQERVSALRTFARARGRPLERLPAEPRCLAAELSEVSPIAAGISRGRWANVRCHIRKSVAMVHPISSGRHITPLSPGWKAPWKQLPPQVKMALSRFARFCTVREIEPNQVIENTFKAFRVHLHDSLLKNPDRIFAALVRGWRAAQKGCARLAADRHHDTQSPQGLDVTLVAISCVPAARVSNLVRSACRSGPVGR
jgi:hypothetical protein